MMKTGYIDEQVCRSQPLRNQKDARLQRELGHLRCASNRPSTIAYFDRITVSDIREKELRTAKRRGYKIVGTSCAFVPHELVHAAGAIPLRICSGLAETVVDGEQILPQELCPLVKSLLGAWHSGASPILQLCDMFVFPLGCDAKTKLSEIFAEQSRVLQMEIPRLKQLKNRARWCDELYILKTELEKLTGKKITRTELRKSIALYSRARTILRKIHDLRKSAVNPLWGRDALLVINTLFFDDVARWTARTTTLCAELEKRIATGKGVCAPSTSRIMVAGSPIIWPNYKLLHLLEECGGIVVAEEHCAGARWLYNPIVVDEDTFDDLMNALADATYLPMTCPCFVPNSERLKMISRLGLEFRVDGVVYHQLRGCLLHATEYRKIESMLKASDIPVLKVETDYSESDLQQLKTRIEAFMEMLKK